MKKQIAGLLNQKIEIYSYADIEDGAGGSNPIEVLYWATSAEVFQLKASRTLEANQERLKPIFTFTVRYRDDKFVNEDMIIKWRRKSFRINQAEPDFIYKEFLTITCIGQDLPDSNGVIVGNSIYIGATNNIAISISGLTPISFIKEFILNTGTSNRFLNIVTENEISSITDLNLPLFNDLTNDYILQSNINVNGLTYKVYTLELAVPYSENHEHKVILA